MFIFPDKTSNIYEIPAEHHEKLLKNNITKTYRKAPPKLASSINLEATRIAKNMKFADRIEQFEKAEAFITMKDYKESFVINPTCRLINPCKKELGKISKHIQEQINKELSNHLTYNQWKNINCVIGLFKSINGKSKYEFIRLDIKELYPPITEDISENTITFAKTFISINDSDLRIVKYCRKPLLFSKEEVWKKKSSPVSTLPWEAMTAPKYDGLLIL